MVPAFRAASPASTLFMGPGAPGRIRWTSAIASIVATAVSSEVIQSRLFMVKVWFTIARRTDRNKRHLAQFKCNDRGALTRTDCGHESGRQIGSNHNDDRNGKHVKAGMRGPTSMARSVRPFVYII